MSKRAGLQVANRNRRMKGKGRKEVEGRTKIKEEGQKREEGRGEQG